MSSTQASARASGVRVRPDADWSLIFISMAAYEENTIGRIISARTRRCQTSDRGRQPESGLSFHCPYEYLFEHKSVHQKAGVGCAKKLRKHELPGAIDRLLAALSKLYELPGKRELQELIDAQPLVAEHVKLLPGYFITWGGQFENAQASDARCYPIRMKNIGRAKDVVETVS